MTDNLKSPQQQPSPQSREAAVKGKEFTTYLRWLVLGLLVLCFAFLAMSGTWKEWDREKLVAAFQAWGVWGGAAYAAVYCVVSALGFPASILSAAGAILYGTLWGTVINMCGVMGGSMLSFVVARHLAGGLTARILGARVSWLHRRLEKHGFTATLYMRLALFPFAPLNYGAGISGVRAGDFFWGTLVGLLPIIFLFTYVISNIAEIRSLSDLQRPGIVFGVLLFAASFAAPFLIKRIRRWKGWAGAVKEGNQEDRS